MLILYHNGEEYPLENTEYYIRELANGLDEVVFSLDIHDPIYQLINEEENVFDRDKQIYKVKQIDGGAIDAKIICQLDIDAWRSSLTPNYNSGTKTVYQQINAVCPAGWTVLDRSGINIGRTIEGDVTPYDVCVQCTSIYEVYIRWDNKAKTCTIYPKAMSAPVGSFATRELNLKEINYKGKSNDLVTRLYAYGKDDLSFADINDGKPYVDNFDYTSEIICGIWRDDRYEVKQNLLDDARAKLAKMSKPERTYECSIVDLQATNPELYNNLDFSLFTSATLIDDIKNTSVDYQVVERHIYPYHPDKNEVIFNSEPLKITTAVISLTEALESPNSTFQQIQAARIASATNWLTNGNGYVVAVKNDDGSWKELLFMDTPDTATAQKVLRINENGIGFSTTGINGPYTNAWTIDGQLVADFITTGTLNANVVNVIGKIMATSGYIGADSSQGWNIGSKFIYNGVTAFTDASHEGVYIGTDGIRYNASPTAATPLGATRISKTGIQSDFAVNAFSFLSGKSGHVYVRDASGNNSAILEGSDGSVKARSFKTEESGSTYNGATGQISWAWDGHGYALNVKNGIVVGITQT